ncbi:MAG: low molecular weight protein-tyrosine-phosphatase [Acidimicrobiales bacterium]
MAEAVTRHLLSEAGLSGRVHIESFGTAGYHAGEPMDPGAAAALGRRGWADDGHRARRLGAGDLDVLDLVLCADRSNVAEVQRLGRQLASPPPTELLRAYDPACSGEGDEVPDPWGGGMKEFDEVLTIVERSCRGLVSELARSVR